MAGKKCISLQEDNDRRAAIMMRKVSRNKTMEILGVASERLFMNGNQRHDIRNHWFAPSCWTIAVKPATKRLCFSPILSTESKWNFDSLELSSRTGCPRHRPVLGQRLWKPVWAPLPLPWLCPDCQPTSAAESSFYYIKETYFCQHNFLVETIYVVQLVPMSAKWECVAFSCLCQKCHSSAVVVPQ